MTNARKPGNTDYNRADAYASLCAPFFKVNLPISIIVIRPFSDQCANSRIRGWSKEGNADGRLVNNSRCRSELELADPWHFRCIRNMCIQANFFGVARFMGDAKWQSQTDTNQLRQLLIYVGVAECARWRMTQRKSHGPTGFRRFDCLFGYFKGAD